MKLNKTKPNKNSIEGYGYGLNPYESSIILRDGAPEISARDIVPKEYLFSYFIVAVVNNKIDTDSSDYNAVWKKMVDNAHITDAKEIHKQMSERNETGVQYVTKKKKAPVEDAEEEPMYEGSDDGSGSGEEVTVVRKKRRRGSSDRVVSVND
jgi:hypothetical protein